VKVAPGWTSHCGRGPTKLAARTAEQLVKTVKEPLQNYTDAMDLFGPENPLRHLQMHRASYISTGILSGIDVIALSLCSRRSSQRAPMRLPAHQ
jgi:hypothetical protein